jgi:hypothetical protein
MMACQRGTGVSRNRTKSGHGSTQIKVLRIICCESLPVRASGWSGRRGVHVDVEPGTKWGDPGWVDSDWGADMAAQLAGTLTLHANPLVEGGRPRPPLGGSTA